MLIKLVFSIWTSLFFSLLSNKMSLILILSTSGKNTWESIFLLNDLKYYQLYLLIYLCFCCILFSLKKSIIIFSFPGWIDFQIDHFLIAKNFFRSFQRRLTISIISWKKGSWQEVHRKPSVPVFSFLKRKHQPQYWTFFGFYFWHMYKSHSFFVVVFFLLIFFVVIVVKP